MVRYAVVVTVGVGTYLIARSQGAPRWGAAVAVVVLTMIVLEITALWKDRS